MSWWIQRKGKDGKNHMWAIDVDPLVVIMLIAILFAVAGPTIIQNPYSSFAIFAASVIIIGLACLMISKVSLYRQGIWFSWGTRSMSKGNARLYIIGYTFIVIGAFLLIKLAAKKG